MRKLSEQEQRVAYETFNHLYDTAGRYDNLQMVEYAFAAGLDHAQTKIDELEVIEADKITT